MSASNTLPPDEAALVLTWVGAAAATAWAWWGDGYFVPREAFAAQISGYAALGFLALSLLAGPLARGLGAVSCSVSPAASGRLARQAGIACALMAWVHLAVVWLAYLGPDWVLAFEAAYLRSGLFSFLVLQALLLASVKPLMARLGWQLWKPLFRLSLAAAALVLHHMLYAPFASTRWTLGLFALAAGVYFLRWLPARSCRAAS